MCLGVGAGVESSLWKNSSSVAWLKATQNSGGREQSNPISISSAAAWEEYKAVDQRENMFLPPLRARSLTLAKTIIHSDDVQMLQLKRAETWMNLDDIQAYEDLVVMVGGTMTTLKWCECV